MLSRKSTRVPRPVLDVLMAVYRATAGKTHHRFYVNVDSVALPLNRGRAEAAIMLTVLSGYMMAGGDPPHSAALTEEGRAVLRQRRMIDLSVRRAGGDALLLLGRRALCHRQGRTPYPKQPVRHRPDDAPARHLDQPIDSGRNDD